MTGSEQREAARQFINRWRGKGKEDEDGRSYWIELLSNVFGVENVTERIDFEKKVVVDGNTKRIDVYIPETRVIIEQKSLNIPLDKKIRNSGGIDLTPFDQADRYNSKLIFDERARWIVTCNFAEIWIYDVISADELNYIMGNPPFVGNSRLGDSQRAERSKLFDDIVKEGLAAARPFFFFIGLCTYL